MGRLVVGNRGQVAGDRGRPWAPVGGNGRALADVGRGRAEHQCANAVQEVQEGA